MQPSALPTNVVSELALDVRRDDGTTVPLTVRLWVPVPSTGRDCWQCEYQLEGYRNVRRPIYGVDSWQALQLAFRIVEAELSGLMPRLLYLDAPADPKLLFGGPPAA